MVQIIKHDNYNANINNDTVVMGEDGVKKFKIMENIWIDLTPVEETVQPTKQTAILMDHNYCKTDQAKSLYLKQMSTLFERINTTKSGKLLLETIAKGIPLSRKLSTKTFNSENSFISNTGKVYSEFVTIYPLLGRIDKNSAQAKGLKKSEKILYGKKTKLFFSPEVVFSMKVGTRNLNYLDPAVGLYHELVHCMHSNYGVIDIDLHKTYKIEEYITFGGEDRAKMEDILKEHDEVLRNRLEETAKYINDNISVPDHKSLLGNKYFLTKEGDKYVVTDEVFKQFKYNMQDANSEYIFAKELGVPPRTNYDAGVYVPFEIDVSNKDLYTAEKGILKGFSFSSNELPLHSKIKFTSNKHKDDFYKLKNSCNSRHSRDTSNNYLILEEIYTEIKNRIKRSDCSVIENLLEQYDTYENKISQFPKESFKYIDDNYKEKKLTGRKIQVSDDIKNKKIDLYSKIEIQQEHVDIDSFKDQVNDYDVITTNTIGSLLNLNQTTLKNKEDAHRYNKGIDYKEQAIEFKTEGLNENMKRGDVSHTHSKYFPKTMKVVHGTTTALQLFDILSTIKNDFTVDKDSKDSVHKINDLAQATPFLASALEGLRVVKAGSAAPILGYAAIALNLGVDIYDKNYVGLAEDIGIFILLEAFPELALPLMLFGYIKQWLDNIERREQIKASIIKLLEQRDEYIDISAINMEKNWSKALYNKIHISVDSIEKQLIYNAEAFIHNIKHKIHKIAGSEKDKEKLHLRLLSVEKKIWKNIEIVRKSMLNTLYDEASKLFIDKYKNISLQQMSSLSEDTKKAVKEILAERDSAINDSFIQECLDQMDSYIKKHDIGNKLDLQVKELQNMIVSGKKNIKDENIPTSCITVVNNKITDIICNKTINSKSQIKEGRKDKSFTINNEELRIYNDVYTNLNINHSFTISFWIKLPKGLVTEASKALSLIKCGINNNQGWEIGLKDKKVYYSIYVDGQNKVTLESINNIPRNKWTKITISNKRSSSRMVMYINANKEVQHNYTMNYQIEEHRVDNKAIIFCSSSREINYEISEFKTYYEKFNMNNVISNYHKDFDQNILYDYSGEPLRTDKEYHLVNKSFPNYYYQILEDLKLVLLEEKPKIKPIITIEGKDKVIEDKEVVKLKLDNQILGLKIEALQKPSISYTICEEQVNCTQQLQQISRLWVSSATNKTTNTLKLFSLKDFFIDDKYDYSAIGIITSDVQDENMSGVLINLLDTKEGVICMSTNTYLNTAVQTSMNSKIIPIKKPILDRGKLEGNELIEAMSFYLVRKD